MKGCELATGSPCCREERPGWVYAYITFAIFTAFWVLWVALSLSQLVMGGTVSHWYFAPTGSSTIGNIKRSLRNEHSDQVLMNNCHSSIFRGCFLRMSKFPKCQIRFASIFASISGDSFWESSKKSRNLLLRTSLPSIVTPKGPFHYWAIQILASLMFLCTLLQTLVVSWSIHCSSVPLHFINFGVLLVVYGRLKCVKFKSVYHATLHQNCCWVNTCISLCLLPKLLVD